jgi:hypothetical protein
LSDDIGVTKNRDGREDMTESDGLKSSPWNEDVEYTKQVESKTLVGVSQCPKIIKWGQSQALLQRSITNKLLGKTCARAESVLSCFGFPSGSA